MILRSILPWLVITVALFPLSFAAEFDFTVMVAAGRIQCYFQSIPADQPYVHMDIDYQVIILLFIL